MPKVITANLRYRARKLAPSRAVRDVVEMFGRAYDRALAARKAVLR